MPTCHICLTSDRFNGNVPSTLFPSPQMSAENAARYLTSQAKAPESAPSASRSMYERLKRIATSTKSKVATAILAAAGAMEAGNKAEAATMVPASVTRGFDLHEFPDDAAGFQLDQISIRTGNAEDGNMDAIDFVTFTRQNDDIAFDIAFNYDGDVPLNVLAPNDSAEDGIISPYLMYTGEIPTFQDGRVAVGASSPLHQSPGLFSALEGTQVHIGIGGDFEGDPMNATTPEELVAMYSGRVLEAMMPDSINVEDHYIVHSYSTVPEPSTLGLLGAAGVAGAAGLRRRKQANKKN